MGGLFPYENPMLSRLEILKDNLQEVVEAGTTRTGHVATIIIHAIVDVTKEIGGLANDVFEIREAGSRARAEHDELTDDED